MAPGSGLPVYANDAAVVIGVEPDLELLDAVRARPCAAQVLRGSAEHIPLAEDSVDLVHARSAYFFPPGCGAGVDEVLRVLRPGGTLVVVDNDLRHGEFAELVRDSPWAAAQGHVEVSDQWWQRRGADRTEVMSSWRFDSRPDTEAVLRMEIPPMICDPWLLAHPDRLHLSYGFVLFALDRQSPASRLT